MTPSADVIPFAVGTGYDVHQLVRGRRLVLGGVEIPHEVGLLGHSDADVLIHAIADALLGAAGLGDIGHHFPNNDEKWRDADSRELLRIVVEHLRELGWRIGNVDATLIAQAPRIAPHIALMRERLGADMGIPDARVNIKATTNERLGFIGRSEGIAAMATALILK